MERAARQGANDMNAKRQMIDKAQARADYTNDVMVVGQVERGDEYFVRPAYELFDTDLSSVGYILVIRPTRDEKYDGLSAAQVLKAVEFDLHAQEQTR
jgi:hypothetical protein